MGREKLTYEELENKILALEEKLRNCESPTIPENPKDTESFSKSELNFIRNRFWLLAESSPIAMCETNADGSCIYVNKKWRELAGLSTEEALGDGWQKGLHPDDRENIFKNWKKHAKSLKPWSFEYRFQSPKGKVSWVYGTSIALTDEQGQITGYLGTNIDITEQKFLQQENKFSEQTYKNLYRSTPAIMHSTNNKGEIIDVSTKWLTELGYSPEEVIGKKSIQFLTEKSRKMAVEKYFPIFWKEGHLENIEYQFVKKDGSIMDVLLSATSERDEDGNIFRTLAILEDITQQKKDREAILESQKRYQSLFYNSPIPLWEEDFTELFEFIELKKNQGVNDFEKYLDENPEEVLLCSQKIKIIDVNNAAIKLHEAKSKDELLGNLDKIFTDKSILNFKDEIIALANGQIEFETKGEVKTLKGNTRKILLRLINDNKTQSSANVIVATLDINERTEAEEELRITREQFKNLFDNAQVGLFSVDLKSGRFIEANKHAAHIAGYNNLKKFKKEYITKEQYVIPKLRETVQEQLKNNGNILNFPIEMFGKGKRKYWVELSGKMNPDNGLFEGAINDITDRKHAEKALVESQERFYLAMQATKDGLYDWNLLTNEIYYSPGYKSMLGYEDHEIKNDFSSWENLTHPDDVKKSWSILKDHLEGKTDRFELDFRMKHKNGNWVDIRSRANAIFDENKKPIRVIGTHIDITEQKQINKILDQERKLTQHYLDVADVMFIAINKDQEVTLINPKGCEILGYTNEEVIGKNWFDNFLPQENIDSVKSVFNQLISGDTGNAKYFENPILRKDGSKRIIAWHNSFFDDESGNIIGLFSSGIDSTERIEAETILLNERQRAKNILQGTNAGTWDWNIQTEEIINELPRGRAHEVSKKSQLTLMHLFVFFLLSL